MYMYVVNVYTCTCTVRLHVCHDKTYDVVPHTLKRCLLLRVFVSLVSGELLIWLNTSDPHYGQIFRTEFIHTTRLWCSVAYFLRYVGQFASSWLIVVIALERYVLLAHPIRIMRRQALLMTSAVIVSIFAVSVCLNAYPFWTLDIKDYGGYTMCNVTDFETIEIWTWIMIRVGSLLIPGVLVLVFTALIIWKLREFHTTSQNHMIITINGIKTIHESDQRFTEVDKQHIAMLIIVAIFFLLLRLPYIVMYYVFSYREAFIGSDVSPELKHRLWLALDICYALAALNYAVNFFLYCFSSSLFRDRFLCKSSARHADDHRTSGAEVTNCDTEDAL